MKLFLGSCLVLILVSTVSCLRIFPLKDAVTVKPTTYKPYYMATVKPAQAPSVYSLISGSYDKTKRPSGHIEAPSRDLLPPKEDAVTAETPDIPINITPKSFTLEPTIVKRNSFRAVTVAPGIDPTPVLSPDYFTTVPAIPRSHSPKDLNCDTTSLTAQDAIDLIDQEYNVTDGGLMKSSQDPIVGNQDKTTMKKKPILDPVLPLVAEEEPTSSDDDGEGFWEAFFNQSEMEKNNATGVELGNKNNDGVQEEEDPLSLDPEPMMEQSQQPALAPIRAPAPALAPIPAPAPALAPIPAPAPALTPVPAPSSAPAPTGEDLTNINTFISMLFNNKTETENPAQPLESNFSGAVEPDIVDEQMGANITNTNVEQPSIPTADSSSTIPSSGVPNNDALSNAEDVNSFISILFGKDKPTEDQPIGAPVTSTNTTTNSQNENDMNLENNENQSDLDNQDGTENENESNNTAPSTSTAQLPIITPVIAAQPSTPPPASTGGDPVTSAKDIDSFISLLFDEKEYPRNNNTLTLSNKPTIIDSGNVSLNQSSNTTPISNSSSQGQAPALDDEEGDFNLDESDGDRADVNNPPQPDTALPNTSVNADQNEKTGSTQFMTSQPNIINLGNAFNPPFNNNLLPGVKTTQYLQIIQHIASHSTPNNTDTKVSTKFTSKVVTESDKKDASDAPKGGALNQVSYEDTVLEIPGIDRLPLEETSGPAYPTAKALDTETNTRPPIITNTPITPLYSQTVSYGPFSINVPAIDVLPLQDVKTNPYKNKATSYQTNPVGGVATIKAKTEFSEKPSSSGIRGVNELILELAPPKGSDDVITLEVIPAHIINVKTASANGKVKDISVVLLPPKLTYLTKYQ